MKAFMFSAFAVLLSHAALAIEAPIPIGELKRGTMVTVVGTVERITDEDEFRLADPSGTVRVYIGPNWVPARVGEVVSVVGYVDDDAVPLEVYARSLKRADGTEILFRYDYD